MSPRPLTFAVQDHTGKAAGLTRSLQRTGHQLVELGRRADLLLIDHDMQRFHFRPLIDQYKAFGAKVLVYPHGGGPLLGYDNIWEPYEHVDGHLVFGPGQAELHRRLDHPTPSHVVGWAYGATAPFRARADVRHVVYAPTHPTAGGHALPESNRQANAETFAQLLKGPWRLTVRHLGSIEQNGLWHVDGVNFVRSSPSIAPVEIDVADAVVAGEGTFPSLAIARGVPTVMCSQSTPPEFGFKDEPVVPLRNPGLYLDYARYPFDATDGPLDEIVHAAARSEAPIAQWKRRWVGERLDDHALAALVARVAEGRPIDTAIDETRAFTVVALADELAERPELLAAYARNVGPEDDATLVIWGAGFDAEPLLGVVQAAAEAARLDDADLPDILLLPTPAMQVMDRRLAERADALLSEWPAAGRIGELPRYSATAQPAWA